METQRSAADKGSELDELLAFHRRRGRGRIAASLSLVFALLSGLTSAALLWPGPCEQLSQELCRGAWLQSCEGVERALNERVSSMEDAENYCAEHLDTSYELSRLTFTTNGEPPSLYFLGLLREVVGHQRFADLQISARVESGRVTTVGIAPQGDFAGECTEP